MKNRKWYEISAVLLLISVFALGWVAKTPEYHWLIWPAVLLAVCGMYVAAYLWLGYDGRLAVEEIFPIYLSNEEMCKIKSRLYGGELLLLLLFVVVVGGTEVVMLLVGLFS